MRDEGGDKITETALVMTSETGFVLHQDGHPKQAVQYEEFASNLWKQSSSQYPGVSRSWPRYRRDIDSRSSHTPYRRTGGVVATIVIGACHSDHRTP